MSAAPRRLRSPMIDARHGFSTRCGGVSDGRYASLNLGAKWGDDASRVEENRRRLASDAGFDLAGLATARQVHGTRCLIVGPRHTLAATLAGEEADALISEEPGVTLGVTTADCVPILLSDGEGRVAAVHAGWRGTVAGIAAAAVHALVSVGARRDGLRAAIGPSIGPCCFEVGDEVAERFAASEVARRPGAKPHVDLRLANQRWLVEAGLDPRRIDAESPCTMCDPDRFFSFRRDGGNIGQMLSFISAGSTSD